MTQHMQKLAEGYTLSPKGTILNPGKFEGEPVAILYFWEAMLNGMSDNGDSNFDAFDLIPSDRLVCDSIPADAMRAYLYHSEQGFEHLEYSTEDWEG